jgi:hypothetical protein
MRQLGAPGVKTGTEAPATVPAHVPRRRQQRSFAKPLTV